MPSPECMIEWKIIHFNYHAAFVNRLLALNWVKSFYHTKNELVSFGKMFIKNSFFFSKLVFGIVESKNWKKRIIAKVVFGNILIHFNSICTYSFIIFKTEDTIEKKRIASRNNFHCEFKLHNFFFNILLMNWTLNVGENVQNSQIKLCQRFVHIVFIYYINNLKTYNNILLVIQQ